MAADPSDFVELGEVIGGYRLERVLGAGSTSQVFLGKHVVLGRRAAIKVLVHKLIGNEDVINRLLTEAKVVNDIRHPNIIDISDFINTATPRRVALVMEYVEGPSLTICREHPLTFEQAIGTMLQLVAAVRAAHSAGIIHRDIKPDNLLLTADPRNKPKEVPALKIVDFGIAKMAHSNLAQTAVGTMLGTPAYMAPEQIAGRPRPSAATDVFAIGEVLYEVLTSRRAYPAGTISETVRSKLRGEIPELNLPPMPGDKMILEIIRRCLSHRPEDRPGLQEIHNLLESVRPGGERIETLEDLEDVDSDASEIETRMVDPKPIPAPATTELTPISPSAPTDANPVPPRAIPKDVTSPTNRVLPALTELDPIPDRPSQKNLPNAPTIPGSLNRLDLSGRTSLVRDEQPLSIGELRIADVHPRSSDDEASMHISDFELSRIQDSSENDSALALAQPVGLGNFDHHTELDQLDADDLSSEESDPTPFNEQISHLRVDNAVTVPPELDGPPDFPDTRITEVRQPGQPSNRLFYVILLVIGAGTLVALTIATNQRGWTEPTPAPKEQPIGAPPPSKPTVTEKPGLFHIESEPSGADVLHVSEDPDTEPLPLGRTPLSLQLSGNTWPQTLRIVHPGYLPLEVEATPNNRSIEVKLTKR